MRNVWILNHYAQEPGSGGGTRHFDLARHLPESGWNASIIAAGTELNTGRQRLAPDEAFRLDTFDGIRFLWLATPAYRGNGPGRMRNMLTYTVRSLGKATKALPRPEAIVGSSVHPFAAWAGYRLAVRYGVPFVFEVRDLWPETLIDMGAVSRNHPLAVGLRQLEKHLYRKADKIVSLLPYASNYIGRFGVPDDKIVWIPNGVDLSRFPHRPQKKEGNPFTFMYFGAHGGANGLDTVTEAMRGLPYRLRLIGDGPAKARLMRTAPPNVSFENPVSKKEIPSLAAEADAFVFNLIDAPVFKYGISSNKLFDFMAAARPILFVSGAANNPVADARCGLSIPPGDTVALRAAMRQIATIPVRERASMGENARRYVEENHDLQALARKLSSVLDGAIGSPHGG